MTDQVLQTLINRFAESDCSWLSTVRPNGRLHSAPIWHVWLAGKAYVVTVETAVKVPNIRHNPSVTITHPDPKDVVIIEGTASFAPEKREALKPMLKAKYDWDLDDSEEAPYNTIIEIRPTKVIAWGKYGEGRWSGKQLDL